MAKQASRAGRKKLRQTKARTAAQRAALKKAQAASARKRRKGGSSKSRRNKRIKTGLAVVGGLVVANYAVKKGARGAKRTRSAYRSAKKGSRGTRY